VAMSLVGIMFAFKTGRYRKPTFWGAWLNPFLRSAAGTLIATGIGGLCFLRINDEEMAGFIVLIVFSSIFFLLLLIFRGAGKYSSGKSRHHHDTTGDPQQDLQFGNLQIKPQHSLEESGADKPNFVIPPKGSAGPATGKGRRKLWSLLSVWIVAFVVIMGMSILAMGERTAGETTLSLAGHSAPHHSRPADARVIALGASTVVEGNETYVDLPEIQLDTDDDIARVSISEVDLIAEQKLASNLAVTKVHRSESLLKLSALVLVAICTMYTLKYFMIDRHHSAAPK